MESMTAYSTLHTRLRTQRGRASAHQCTKCAEQARDWAQIHGTDGEDVWEHYVPMCRRCHMDYDQSGHRTPHSEETKELLSQRNRGYRHTPEAVEKIRKTSTGRQLSAEAKAKVSAARKGSTVSTEQREKISNKLKGNKNASGKRSEDSRARMRAGWEKRKGGGV